MLDFKIETFPHNLIEEEINLLIIEDNMDDYYIRSYPEFRSEVKFLII